MSKVFDLRPRIARVRPERPVNLLPYPCSASEVAHYERAAIHEGVLIPVLVGALNRAVLTFSNVVGHGLVIHRIGQDPHLPAPTDPGAS